MTEVAQELAMQHGEAIGIEVNGYPTSWCHTAAEIVKVKNHLQKETQP